MLASAFTQTTIIFGVLIVAAFMVSVSGFVDLLRRPLLACRVAHVSKVSWLVLLGLSVATILTAFAGMLYVAPAQAAVVFMMLGVLPGLMGLITGTWYLVAVRPWVVAQVDYARH